MSGYFQRLAEDNEAHEEYRDGLELDNATLRARVEKLERVKAAAKEYVKLHDNPDSNDTEAWLCACMEVGQELDAALVECPEVDRG